VHFSGRLRGSSCYTLPVTQQPKPQIKIDHTLTVIEFNPVTKTFYTDLDYDVTQAPTIEELASKLRWKGKAVKLINREDDGMMNVCFIFAKQPGCADSDDVWMVPNQEEADRKVESLKSAHPHLANWRTETARIDVDTWRRNRSMPEPLQSENLNSTE
jgi:hypothetical protein